MELKNTFEVAAPPKSSWDFLLDPARVTPCIPGAELIKVDDEGTWHVKAKVKLGPVTMNYKGKVNIVEKDDEGLKVIMKGTGTETRGKGTVKADIVSQLSETNEGGTRAEITSTVKIAGKAAQFGRGMIADVAGRFTTDFAEAMEHALAEAAQTEASEAAAKASEAATKAAEEAKAAIAKQKEEEARAASENEDDDESSSGGPGARATHETATETLDELKKLVKRAEKAAKKAESAAGRAEAEATRAEAEAAKADAACKRAEAAAKKMDLLSKERREAKEVGGFGLAFWAIGRAISRFFKRLFGGDKKLSDGR